MPKAIAGYPNWESLSYCLRDDRTEQAIGNYSYCYNRIHLLPYRYPSVPLSAQFNADSDRTC
jgi:hypothetical protein